MQGLPSDILGKLAGFCTVSSCWSMSRACKHTYLSMNKKIYSIFEKQFLREVFWKEFQYNIKIELQLPKCDMSPYFYSGSLVWTTLLGESWKDRHIEIFSYHNTEQAVDFCRNMDGNPKIWTVPVDNHVSVYVYPLIEAHWDHLKVVDIIPCSESDSFEDVINKFHIVGFSNYFDPLGKTLYIKDAQNTLFKRTRRDSENIKGLYGSLRHYFNKLHGNEGIEFTYI